MGPFADLEVRLSPASGHRQLGHSCRLSVTSGLMHCTNFVSLDHLVGAAERRWRDLDAELFCRLEIYYQFELGRLRNRQFRGLFAHPARHRHIACRHVSGKLVP